MMLWADPTMLKLIYTQNEYLLYLLRGDKPDVQGAHTPKYPKTRMMMME